MLRKIEPKENLAEKKRKRTLIIGFVLIGLMTISSVGYSFMNNEKDEVSKENYNGYEFTRNQGYWTLTIQDQVFYFQNLPQDVEEIPVVGFYSLQDYAGKPLYFVNDNAASRELLLNLERYLQRYQAACLENCTELPVKNCTDNLIIYNLNETETRVWKSDNCVYISGDLIKATDAFLYRLFGVKN